MRTVVLIALLFLTLVVRLPGLFVEVGTDERAHVGAARQFLIQRERTPPSLLRDTPAASHLGSPVLWSLRSPAPEYDPDGPDDQMGWLALRDTSLPTGEFVMPAVVALLVRLPFVFLQLVGIYLLFRLGERFYGTAAGLGAAAIAAFAATTALNGAAATPTALALPTITLLLAALEDFVRAAGYEGRPPPWLMRKRTLAVGLASGLALAASFAFLPIVCVGVLWLGGRRNAMERRDDSCQPPAFSRRVVGIAVALAIVWAFYAGDVGRYEEADMTLPAPLWWEGLVAAVSDAIAISWEARWAALSAFDEPTVLVLLGLAPVAWWFLRRDRTDTPALCLVMGTACVATSVLVPLRLAPVAIAAAVPPLALLTAALLVRLARHARLVGVAAAAVLLVGITAGWYAAAPWNAERGARDTADATALTAPLRRNEAWLVERWIASRAPREAVTVLGREPMLRATRRSQIREMSADPERLKAVIKDIDEGADTALIVGDWVRLDDPNRSGSVESLLGDREPTGRFLRVWVYDRR